jgi:serine phosphatase RsbU (regulator of sigma subunit)
MFTDGITEAMNDAGEQLSTERLQESFISGTRDPERCLAVIADHLATHRNGAPPTDDEAMLLLARG